MKAAGTCLRSVSVFISMPMRKMMKNRAIVESAWRSLLNDMTPSTVGPRIMPLNSSPATEGILNCSKTSPAVTAAAKTIRTWKMKG